MRGGAHSEREPTNENTVTEAWSERRKEPAWAGLCLSVLSAGTCSKTLFLLFSTWTRMLAVLDHKSPSLQASHTL